MKTMYILRYDTYLCGSIYFKGSVYPKFPREMNVYNYDKNLVMYGDILHGNMFPYTYI